MTQESVALLADVDGDDQAQQVTWSGDPSSVVLDLSPVTGACTDEKSRLPAIIVTPCHPCGPTDYEIAFLASVHAPKHPALSAVLLAGLPRRTRTLLCLSLPLLVLLLHLLLELTVPSRTRIHQTARPPFGAYPSGPPGLDTP